MRPEIPITIATAASQPVQFGKKRVSGTASTHRNGHGVRRRPNAT
jgi:hypothetical protein